MNLVKIKLLYFFILLLFFIFFHQTSAVSNSIVINEIAWMGTEISSNDEWIELKNTTNADINLDNWILMATDGSPEINLSGIVPSGEYFLLERTDDNSASDIAADQIYTGALGNSGEVLELKDETGNVIDIVSADSGWPAGDNANKLTMERMDSGNWQNSQETGGTPKAANSDESQNNDENDESDDENNNQDQEVATSTLGDTIINEFVSDPVGEEDKNNKIYSYSDCVIISEILPNPKGSDSENEFIELYNNCEQDVDLIKWKLEDESGKKYEFKINNKIKASEYLAVYRKESKIALNNNGDSIKLYQPLKEEALQIVKYQKAIEGWSYVDTQILVPGKDPGAVNKIATNESWVWSEIVTPGKINIIKTINHPPIIDFYSPDIILIGTPVIFDSSDTIDEDDDDLKFQWDFGDGIKLNLPSPEHTYLKSGIYAIKLIVSDNENAIEKEKIVSVQDDCCALPKPYGCLDVNVKENCNLIANIIINEILPNPEGPDAEEEWIELKNIGNTKINLLNWKLNDAVVDGKGYKFNSDAWIDSDDFFVVYRPDSKITLNNNFDTIKLFNNFDALVDEVEYQKAPIGESYVKNQNKKWFWTTILTPGKENIFSEQFSDATISKTLQKSSKSKNYIVETTLEKIREFESGDLIKVKGVVAVKPNVFSSQYFYIVGSQGIQVYSYKKDFPDLRVGDYVEINGELSTIIGEQRLKTKSSDSIKILEHRQEPIAEEVSSDKINEDYVGRLVAVSGEAVEQKGSTIYLDDGMDEVQIYVKKLTDINPKSIKVGDQVKITGIVSKTNSGVKIMPRSSDDIVKINVSADSNADEILGSIAVNDEWEIAQRNKKMELFKYLLVFACGIIIILIGMLIKLKKEL
ncbi:lamin tail domain-containing protein [Patescibacteria group bacterium]|nr:lamin tail domain-containing protein [Patescibacteria group bacterium]